MCMFDVAVSEKDRLKQRKNVPIDNIFVLNVIAIPLATFEWNGIDFIACVHSI